MQLNSITVEYFDHPEKMGMVGTFQRISDAEQAINDIFHNRLGVFNHSCISLTLRFDDGFEDKYTIKVGEGLNGSYFITDLIDELVELFEKYPDHNFFGVEELYQRLMILQKERDRYCEELFGYNSDLAQNLEDVSFLSQMKL